MPFLLSDDVAKVVCVITPGLSKKQIIHDKLINIFEELDGLRNDLAERNTDDVAVTMTVLIRLFSFTKYD
jgi:hypothetical protein